MEKNLIKIKYVAKNFPTHPNLSIQNHTQDRNHTSVKIVINFLIIPHDCWCIREFMQERNHTNVSVVTNPSINNQTLKIISESIPERNHTSVRTMTNPIA
jgi:hypothetical protein